MDLGRYIGREVGSLLTLDDFAMQTQMEYQGMMYRGIGISIILSCTSVS